MQSRAVYFLHFIPILIILHFKNNPQPSTLKNSVLKILTNSRNPKTAISSLCSSLDDLVTLAFLPPARQSSPPPTPHLCSLAGHFSPLPKLKNAQFFFFLQKRSKGWLVSLTIITTDIGGSVAIPTKIFLTTPLTIGHKTSSLCLMMLVLILKKNF